MKAETDLNPVTLDASESFYGAALARITRLIWILGAVGTPFVWPIWGFRFALGWVVGAAVSFSNFRSLAASVNALGDRIVTGYSRESGGLIVAKFLLRYALLAIAAYAIFKISEKSLYGLLTALFLPVAATSFEAAYETFVALRRGL